MLEPIKRSRIYEHIVEQIRARVAEGTLKPGDQLLSERDLAAALQVSRTSVREALRALEAQGLIHGKQGGGTFIREMSSEVLVQRLAAVLARGDDGIEEILEVRELIEPGVARLAAERATPKLVGELARLCELQRSKIALGESYSDVDAAFHDTLAVAARNGVLLRLQNTIAEMLDRTRTEPLQGPERHAKSLRGHEAILEAVRRRDGQAAYRATLQHISEVRDTILALPKVSNG